MGIIDESLPTPGESKHTGETDVRVLLTALKATINGGIDLENLSATLRAAVAGVAPTLVDELPADPADGEVVYFQNTAMAAVGVVWMLRYRDDSGSTYKWEFVGGAAFANDVDASGSDPDGTPTLTVPPLDGDYDVEFGARVQVTNSGGTPPTAGMYIEVDSVFSDTLQVILANTAGTTSTVGNVWGRTRATLSSGDVLVAKYGTSGGSGTVSFSNRRLAITPVRVG